MFKFKTGGLNPGIKKVEIEKETDKCVYVKSNWRNGKIERQSKNSHYGIFHETWLTAWEHLLKNATSNLERKVDDVKRAEKRLTEIQEMKEPV